MPCQKFASIHIFHRKRFVNSLQICPKAALRLEIIRFRLLVRLPFGLSGWSLRIGLTLFCVLFILFIVIICRIIRRFNLHFLAGSLRLGIHLIWIWLRRCEQLGRWIIRKYLTLSFSSTVRWGLLLFAFIYIIPSQNIDLVSYGIH